MRLRWILNFHGLGAVPPHVGADEAPYWVSEDRFVALLERTAGLDHLELTFDDGNRSDCEIALPILLRHRRTATFFACAGRLDDPRYLAATDLAALRAAGMRVGSHGWSHRAWASLPPAEQRQEWSIAKAVLESAAGCDIDEAACPFGAYDAESLRGLRSAGFRHVYTSDRGPARSGSWLQARTTLTASFDPLEAAEEVRTPPGLVCFAATAARQFLKGRR